MKKLIYMLSCIIVLGMFASTYTYAKEMNVANDEKENNPVINQATKEVVFETIEVTVDEDCMIVDKQLVMTPKESTDYEYQLALDFINTIQKPIWSSIVCMGDSITEGVQSGIDGVNVTYPNVISKLLGIPVHNVGIGGSTIWSGGDWSMCERMDTCGSGDTLFIMGGINDWFYGYECLIGDTNTSGTFSYDLNIVYSYAKNNFKNVFVILPLDTNGHLGVEPYDDLSVIRGVEKDLATNYGFHIIDLPSKNIMSALDEETRNAYFSDSCHPNDEGYKVLGTIITYEAMKQIGK